MPQAKSLRRCRTTWLHAVRLPAAHTQKQRHLTNHADFETKMPWQPHTPRWNVACTHDAMLRTFSPTFVVVAMGKQRVPTLARVPIFDARLLRELQAATVSISLEGQHSSHCSSQGPDLFSDQSCLQRVPFAQAAHLVHSC